MFTSRKVALKFILVVALFITVAGAATHSVYATRRASVENFYANCSVFSVRSTVAGYTDDGNGQDRFRYELTDGAGTLLYREDAQRPVKGFATVSVYNLSYQRGATPTVNPITLKIIDLDGAGNPGALLRMVMYDARCMKASGQSSFSGVFAPPESFLIQIAADSPVYAAPGGETLNLKAAKGESRLGVYRTADRAWVATYAGNVLQWLPASAISGRYDLLPPQPTRIERLNFTRSADGVSLTPGYPALLRAGPSFAAAVVGNVEQGTIWKVLGRSADEEWVQMDFNGQKVWINRGLACLMNGEMDDLAVTE